MTRKPVCNTLEGWVRFAADTSGASAIMIALSMPIIVGGLGLGAEVGLWYYTERRAQTVADMAAYSAGVEHGRGTDNISGLKRAAFDSAVENGFRGGLDDIRDFTLSEHVDGPAIVSLMLAEPRPRLFTAIFGMQSGIITVRSAVAVEFGKAAGPHCVLALDPHESDAIRFFGAASGNLEHCGLHANSDDERAILIQKTLSASCISAVGGIEADGADLECGTPRPAAAPVADPFADLEFDTVAPCIGTTKNQTEYSPGRYCGGIRVKGDTHFTSGIYIVEDTFRINQSNITVTGEDVTFLFIGDIDFRINGGDLDLRAPPDGPYADILFFFDPGASGASQMINGNANSVMHGNIYAPTHSVDFRGTANSNPLAASACLGIVARTVTFGGTSDFNSRCEPDGGADASGPSDVTVRLAPFAGGS